MQFICGTLSLHYHFPHKISPYNRISIRFVPRFSHHSIHKNNPGAERAAFRQKMSDAWLIEPIGSGFLKCSILLILCITMMGNFYKRTARGIRQLGYAPKSATRYAGFFFVSLLSVCTAAGVLDIPAEAVTGSNTGSGKSPAGARAGSITPDFFRIHRH
jgi:hypothetical protein